jgi:hypothetical protein
MTSFSNDDNNFNAPKKVRSAAQIIGPHKNKQAHQIFQDVINRWVEALTIEGKIASKLKRSKDQVNRSKKPNL